MVKSTSFLELKNLYAARSFHTAVAFFSSILCLLMLVGCSQSSKYSLLDGEVRIAAYEGDTGLLVWIAEDKGYFKDFGVNVHLQSYSSGKQATDDLLSGSADIATSAEFVVVKESFHQDNLRILGHIAAAESNWLVVDRDTGFKQPGDLRGKRVGVTVGSTGEYFLGRLLSRYGLQISDVTVVDLSPTQIIEQMSSDQIDAAVTWQPNVYHIEQLLGPNVVSFPAQLEQAFFFVLTSTDDWISQRPEHLHRVLLALNAAQKWVQDNPLEVSQYLVKRFGVTPEYAAYSSQIHQWELGFEQALMVAMDAEKRWAIAKGVVITDVDPNFSEYIYPQALARISNNVSVIH